MSLGIFLASGDSFKNMAKSGQDELFKKFYLSFFAKNFTRVYIFSYANEKVNGLPKNIVVVPNKYNLHRYIYGFLMPLLNIKAVKNCDVMRVYHLFGTPPAIVAKFFFGKPFIFNYAYDYKKFAQIEGKFFQTILFTLLESVAILFSWKIFAANKAIFKKLPRNKAVYLPNGVDTNFFKPAKSKKRNEIPVILSVGRLENQKNFEILIMAMKGVNAKLLIVGQGSQKENLEKLAKENNVDLKIVNKVENTKMPQIYNQADGFVLPSLAEGTPKVLLEAMACGLPVIGSQVIGIGEVINNGVDGLFCNTDSKSISSSIYRLLSNSKLRGKLATNARDTVFREYDLANFIQKEIKVLKNNKNQ